MLPGQVGDWPGTTVDVTITNDLGSATATSSVLVANEAPVLGTIDVSSPQVRIGESVVVAGTHRHVPDSHAVPGDSDGDGVLDEDDRCPATVLPDEPTGELRSNRYVATADGFVAGDATAGPSLADTGGCSGAQIIERLDLGKGHQRFGITASALDQWVDGLG